MMIPLHDDYILYFNDTTHYIRHISCIMRAVGTTCFTALYHLAGVAPPQGVWAFAMSHEKRFHKSVTLVAQRYLFQLINILEPIMFINTSQKNSHTLSPSSSAS